MVRSTWVLIIDLERSYDQDRFGWIIRDSREIRGMHN